VIRERVRLIDAHRSPAAILARKLAKRASPALVDAVLRVHLPTIAEFDPVGNCRLASTCRGRLAALADGAVLDALAFAFPALASPAVSRRIALAPLPGLEVLILTRPESRNVPTACLDARAYHVVFHARLLDGRRIIARRWFTWANEEDNDGALTCGFDLADIGTLVDSNSVGLAGIENQCVGAATVTMIRESDGKTCIVYDGQIKTDWAEDDLVTCDYVPLRKEQTDGVALDAYCLEAQCRFVAQRNVFGENVDHEKNRVVYVGVGVKMTFTAGDSDHLTLSTLTAFLDFAGNWR